MGKIEIYIEKVTSEAFLRRYPMNEKCGSKQTNFERTWLCDEKFKFGCYIIVKNKYSKIIYHLKITKEILWLSIILIFYI